MWLPHALITLLQWKNWKSRANWKNTGSFWGRKKNRRRYIMGQERWIYQPTIRNSLGKVLDRNLQWKRNVCLPRSQWWLNLLRTLSKTMTNLWFPQEANDPSYRPYLKEDPVPSSSSRNGSKKKIERLLEGEVWATNWERDPLKGKAIHPPRPFHSSPITRRKTPLKWSLRHSKSILRMWNLSNNNLQS